MNNGKRNVQIKFRVTEKERGLIEEKMKQVPTSNMEAYLRKMAINGYIIQVDHSDIKKINRPRVARPAFKKIRPSRAAFERNSRRRIECACEPRFYGPLAYRHMEAFLGKQTH